MLIYSSPLAVYFMAISSKSCKMHHSSVLTPTNHTHKYLIYLIFFAPTWPNDGRFFAPTTVVVRKGSV